MNKMKFLVFAVILFLSANINAQNNQELGKVYTLKEIINIARKQSIASKQAETTRENRFWQFQSYRSNYRPQLALNGVIPAYNRSFSPVTQEDGTIEFRAIQNNNAELNLVIEQPVSFTGATLFLSSDLNRFDNYLENADIGLQQYHQYSGAPLQVGINQPLFRYNELRWDKKIEPLRFQESQREYFEDLEFVSLNTSRRFFDLMLAQISLQIAEKNVANNDTIFKIAQGRYNLGKIAENELLQLELQLMNSRQQAAEAKLDIETRTLRLKTWVGLPDASELILFLPEDIPDFDVPEDVALTYAQANRSEFIGFRRRVLEADAEIARAKGTTGPQADLFARFGLTNSSMRDGDISEIYDNPKDQQFVRLGFPNSYYGLGQKKVTGKNSRSQSEVCTIYSRSGHHKF
jgi:outer membrane protein